MMLCKRIVAIASTGLVCACSGNPEPVRLLAEGAEVTALVMSRDTEGRFTQRGNWRVIRRLD